MRVEKMSGVTHYMYAGDYIAKLGGFFLNNCNWVNLVY